MSLWRRTTRVARAEDPLDRVVERMLRGDDAAFQLIYRDLNPRLERYLIALVGQVDAEDVASETWAQACRDMSRFNGDADGFRGWVTTIGRHRALDHLRAKGRRPRSAGAIEDFPDWPAADDVEATVDAIVSTEAAILSIAALPQEQAEAVLLRVVMGLDAKSAGAVLGRSAGSVRTAAYRGLRALAGGSQTQTGDISGSSSAEEVR
jgi:RNA polymerase sigma-70 factor (ECF subfamily)